MSIDVHLQNGGIGGSVRGHGTIIRFIGVIRIIRLFYFFESLVLPDDPVCVFGIVFGHTQASIPEVSNKSIEAFVSSIRWHIGSVKSTRRSNTDCESNKKFYLKRVNLEASGTTSKPQKPQKSWSSREYLRNTIRSETVGIEKIRCNKKVQSIG